MSGAQLLTKLSENLKDVRGRMLPDEPMNKYTWFRVGGPADILFQPADEEDLSLFLSNLPEEIPVTVVGVGSNLLVRDGGIEGVVIRPSVKGFGQIEQHGDVQIEAGVAVPDKRLAAKALELNLGGFAFYHGIPGAIGGAVRMNAGCYGSYIADVFVSAKAVTRAGELVELTAQDLNFQYRQSDLPEAFFRGENPVRNQLPSRPLAYL